MERPTTGSGTLHPPTDETVPAELERTAHRNSVTIQLNEKSPIHTQTRTPLRGLVRCLSRFSPAKRHPFDHFSQRFFTRQKLNTIASRAANCLFCPDFAITITATRKSPAATTVANRPIRVAFPEDPPEFARANRFSRRCGVKIPCC